MPETIPFYADINLHFNQLKQALLQRDVAGQIMGQISYNTTEKRVKVFDGVADKKVLQDNDILDEDDMVSDDATKVPSQQSVKAFLDNFKQRLAAVSSGDGASLIGVEDSGSHFSGNDLESVLSELGTHLSSVTTPMNFEGNIDASTNPNYPAGAKGDTYYITVAGRVGGSSGKIVNVGDMLVARDDSNGGDESQVGDDWFVVESNRDQATETALGLVRISTDSQVQGGTDDTTAVSPLKLKNRLQGVGMVSQEAYVLTGSETRAIVAVSLSLNQFTIEGDATPHIIQGSVVEVTGSTGNNGLYTVSSVTLNSLGDTEVVVEEQISSDTADGNMIHGYKNDVSLSNIDATDGIHLQTEDDGQQIYPFMEKINASTVRFWFLSPNQSTNLIGVIQGKFGF